MCLGKGYRKIGQGHEVQPWRFAPDMANHSIPFLLVLNRQLLNRSCSATSSLAMKREGDEAGGNRCSGAAGQPCCTGTCSCSGFSLVAALVWLGARPCCAGSRCGSRQLQPETDLCFASSLTCHEQEHLRDIGSV